MPEMSFASRAMNLRPDHTVGCVSRNADRLGQGLEKRWPATSALIFHRRVEQGPATSRAMIDARALFRVQGAGTGPLRTVPVEDALLLRCKGHATSGRAAARLLVLSHDLHSRIQMPSIS